MLLSLWKLLAPVCCIVILTQIAPVSQAYLFDVCGFMHRSIIHKEKFNKMQHCIRILLFHIYMKLNMFRVTHRPSSRA